MNRRQVKKRERDDDKEKWEEENKDRKRKNKIPFLPPCRTQKSWKENGSQAQQKMHARRSIVGRRAWNSAIRRKLTLVASGLSAGRESRCCRCEGQASVSCKKKKEQLVCWKRRVFVQLRLLNNSSSSDLAEKSERLGAKLSRIARAHGTANQRWKNRQVDANSDVGNSVVGRTSFWRRFSPEICMHNAYWSFHSIITADQDIYSFVSFRNHNLRRLFILPPHSCPIRPLWRTVRPSLIWFDLFIFFYLWRCQRTISSTLIETNEIWQSGKLKRFVQIKPNYNDYQPDISFFFKTFVIS